MGRTATFQDGTHWFVCHTKPRQEWLANDLLRHQGYETLFLHYTDTSRHARRTVDVIRSYFPRYLFVGLTNGLTIYDVNHTIGVSTVLYMSGEALEVPSNVIEELRARGNKEGLCKLTPEQKAIRRRYHKGERIKISAGPLTGFLGAVELDNGRAIKVWLEMFRGKAPVWVEPEQVSPSGRSVR